MTVLLAALLVLAAVALAGAALRWARWLDADGAGLLLAAAPLGAAVAGAWTLLLGVVHLGDSPVLLALVGPAAWLASRRLAPASVTWPALTRGERLALGAVAGAGLAWTAWVLRHPGLAIDPLSYHLPESIIWAQKGTPGSVERLQYDFPQGTYPVTNELLVAWLVGIARTSAPALVWTPAMAALAVLAGWTGLRRLGAPRLPAGAAIAAVLLTPVAASQLIGPHTDLPALAWLWTAAALVALGRPRLLAPALVAAGLAVGTKTTVAPLVVVLAVVAAVRHRHALRALRGPLAVALGLAVATGGVWYLRNLVVHGSPLYPFKATPFGDPVPEFLRRLDDSFLSRPVQSWERNGELYRQTVGGGFVVLVLGVAAPVVRRRRAVLAAAALALFALLTWMSAPFTGAADDPVLDVSATTTRYLLPTLSAAAAAAALTGSRLLAALLAVSAVWSVHETQHLPLLAMPSLATLAAGAVAGALAAWVARPVPAVRLAVAAGAVAVLVASADGFARRQGAAGLMASSPLVTWAAAQPAWRDGDFPIAFAPQLVAPLAGDRLQHPIELIGRTEACAAIGERARRGWVVLGRFPFADRRTPFTADRCLRTPPRGTRVLYGDASFTVIAAG